MSIIARFGVGACIAGCLISAPADEAGAAMRHHGRRHRTAHQAIAHSRAHAAVPAPGYGVSDGETPTCRTQDGTPYDPDIIGGPNHVGDGGPAANLGGTDPCGY